MALFCFISFSNPGIILKEHIISLVWSDLVQSSPVQTQCAPRICFIDQLQWYTPVIPDFGILKQQNLELETSFEPVCEVQNQPCLKTNKKWKMKFCSLPVQVCSQFRINFYAWHDLRRSLLKMSNRFRTIFFFENTIFSSLSCAGAFSTIDLTLSIYI